MFFLAFSYPVCEQYHIWLILSVILCLFYVICIFLAILYNNPHVKYCR